MLGHIPGVLYKVSQANIGFRRDPLVLIYKKKQKT